MPALVRFPYAPPLCELADGGAWERRERVKRGETVSGDGGSEDTKVRGEGEEKGRKR